MISFDSKNIRTWGLLGIGPSVILAGVAEVMRNNPNAFLITADLGRPNGVHKLPEELKDRVFNVGIAEQNMMGVASGMAMEGKQVFALSYAPFITYRCADQFRHLMGNMKLNIKAIGTAAGFTGCSGGASLTALSDVGFARSVPNVTVISPADCAEAVKAVLAVSENDGPAYIRLCGYYRLPMVYKSDFDFTIGKANVLREGSGVAILATGANIVGEALKAGEELDATVADVHTLSPFDGELIGRLAETHRLIVTVEEHNIIGGLGSAVAEYISSITYRGGGESLLRIGTINEALPHVNRTHMLEKCGLTAPGIISRIREVYPDSCG